jgi:hypothetical protein
VGRTPRIILDTAAAYLSGIGRFACHAGIPTGIPKNVGTDADVAT